MTLAVVKEKGLPRPSWFGRDLQLKSGAEFLRERRRMAWNALEQSGLPTSRNEAWRYLSLAPLYETDFQNADECASQIKPEQVASWRLDAPICLVFVDGHFDAELSVGGDAPHGVAIKDFKSALSAPSEALKNYLAHEAGFQLHPFAALNTASFTEGVVIEVAPGIELASTVQILFLSTPGKTPRLTYPRVFISVGRQSELCLVETHAGDSGAVSFNNAVTEMVLAEGARMEHYKMQYESAGSYHIGLTRARLECDSSLTAHAVTLGGSLVRNNVDVLLEGEGASVSLDGLYVMNQHEQCDSHLLVDHAKPHGTSRQLYKGVLDDRSKGVFNGKVVVHEGAIKSDATQINNNLILSKEAEADPKPELEIYNNDVKCSHGATVGQLDEASLFYLRSRGIPEAEARRILVRAFSQDLIERLRWDEVREDCEQRLNTKLDREL